MVLLWFGLPEGGRFHHVETVREGMLYTVVGTIIRFFVSRWYGLPEGAVETVYIYFHLCPYCLSIMNSFKLNICSFL
jgi:hypothetical protein